MNLFLVENDADDREIFSDALKTINYNGNFIVAQDGREALDLIESTDFVAPEYLFLDLNMPRVNGLDFLMKFKQIKKYDYTFVIIYTLSTLEKDKDACLSNGANLFKTKHSSFNDLCSDLKKWLLS